MELYILRHAIAVDRGTPGFERDDRRPLTEKGEEKMHGIARGMKSLGLSFDIILSSPFERAKHTAEIVAETFDCKKSMTLTDLLATDGDMMEFVEYVNRHYAKLQSILVVGHEPYLSGMISLLVSGSEAMSVVMKKGGLCKLSMSFPLRPGGATLEWLLPPKALTRLD